jgi:hypothetical protein
MAVELLRFCGEFLPMADSAYIFFQEIGCFDFLEGAPMALV